MIVAGIDQGTTASKAALLSDDGCVRLLPEARHQQSYPHPGWMEQDPRELLANVRALLEQAAAAGARHVCLANQGETVIAWDRATGEPICPAIVWQDQRTVDHIDALKQAGHEPTSRAASGLPLDAYFSASKFAWILENVAQAKTLAARGKLGLATSEVYFVERLTGRYVTDPSTAGRTGLMNLGTLQWDPRLCAIHGVPLDLLPAIVHGTDAIGAIDTAAGRATLVASLVDQVAALYGHGCRRAGDTKFTFGTGAFALSVTGYDRRGQGHDGTIPAVCWATRAGRLLAAEGGIYSAGAAIEWLRRIGLLGSISELDGLTGRSAAEDGLYFVPALSGLACPHWDRQASGLWIGLDVSTSRESMLKAVLEGIAFRAAEVLDALGAASDARQILSIDGGLARNDYFVRFLAGVSGRRIWTLESVDLTAIGAAELALKAASGVDADESGASPLTRREFEPADLPSSSWRGRFDEARERAGHWRR